MDKTYVTTEEVILNTDLKNNTTIFKNVLDLESTIDTDANSKKLYQKYKPVIYNFLNTLATDCDLAIYIECGAIRPKLHESVKRLLENSIFSINEENDDVLDKKMKDLLSSTDMVKVISLEFKIRINGLIISLLKEVESNPIYRDTDIEPLKALFTLNN